MMNERKEMFFSGLALAALFIVFFITACKLGVSIETTPFEEQPTVTETIECGSIIPIEESPAAAERALQTPTPKPTET